MGSLDNFHTGNGYLALHQDEAFRQRVLKLGLQSPKTWDVPNSTPVAQFQPFDPAGRSGDFPSPLLTEKRENSIMDLFVATRAYTHRIYGDTADSRILYEQRQCPMRRLWGKVQKHMVPLKMSVNRYQPY